MRNLKVAFAVSAALAGGSALAYNPITDGNPFVATVVAGSSALRTGFANEMRNTFCAGATDFLTFSSAGGSGDFRAYSCTLTSTANVPSSLRNKTSIVYYRAEGGSFVGAGTVSGEKPVVKRLLINNACFNTTAAPSSYTCSIGTYCFVTDTATGNLVDDTVELGITDEEPTVFAGENLPDLTNSPFDTTNYATDVLNISSTQAVAQGFALAVSNATTGSTVSDAGVAALTNLPSATVRAIFSNGYSDWHQVPKSDGSDGTVSATTGTTITVCRRDVGSGTQTMASIFFDGATCNAGGLPFVTANSRVIVSNATSGVVTCLKNNKNAIGLLAWNNALTNAGYISIDGVVPNQKNFATGIYQFGSVATINTPTTYTPDANSVTQSTAILARVQSAANLPGYGGTAGLGNNLVGLVGVAGNPSSSPRTYNATAPVATWTNGGASCAPIINQ